jgi:hypothetical protein
MVSQRPVALIVQQLDELQHKLGESITGFGYEPMPNSIGADELSSAENAQSVRTAHSQGTILIQVTADQLSAFIRAITEPALTIAPWTSTRNILEAASISVWLLDEHINLNERISRSYAFRCEGLNEMVKFSYATKDPSRIKKAEKRRDEVLLQAKKLGLTKYDQNGKIKLIKSMPPVTTLVHSQLNEEAAYRLLSAMIHAHNWALIELGFSPVANVPHGKLLGKSLTVESVCYLALVAIRVFQKQIICKCQLFGWATEDIQKTFDNAERTLQAIFLKSTQ